MNEPHCSAQQLGPLSLPEVLRFDGNQMPPVLRRSGGPSCVTCVVCGREVLISSATAQGGSGVVSGSVVTFRVPVRSVWWPHYWHLDLRSVLTLPHSAMTDCWAEWLWQAGRHGPRAAFSLTHCLSRGRLTHPTRTLIPPVLCLFFSRHCDPLQLAECKHVFWFVFPPPMRPMLIDTFGGDLHWRASASGICAEDGVRMSGRSSRGPRDHRLRPSEARLFDKRKVLLAVTLCCHPTLQVPPFRRGTQCSTVHWKMPKLRWRPQRSEGETGSGLYEMIWGHFCPDTLVIITSLISVFMLLLFYLYYLNMLLMFY